MIEKGQSSCRSRGFIKYIGLGIFLISFVADIFLGYENFRLGVLTEITGLVMFIFASFPPSLNVKRPLRPFQLLVGYAVRLGSVLFLYAVVMAAIIENNVITFRSIDNTPFMVQLFFTGFLGILLIVLALLMPSLYNLFRCRTESDDRMFFASMLADLMEMGIPLDEAVSMMGEETHGRLVSRFSVMAGAVEMIAGELERGSNLSSAFSLCGAFPEHWSLLIAEAEAHGDIARSLRLLAQAEPQRPQFSPVISVHLVSIVALVVIAMPISFFYTLPTFISLFEGMSLSLPPITRMVFATGKFFRNPYCIAPLLIFIIPFALIPLLRQKIVSLLTFISKKIPLFWRLEKLNQQAVAASSLAAAISINMPLPSALRFTASATRSSPYRQAFLKFAGDSGRMLTDYLNSQPELFSAPFRWLVTQGEALGSLNDALTTAAEYFDEAYGLERSRTIIVLEICALILVGFIIAFYVISLLLPLYQLIGTLR